MKSKKDKYLISLDFFIPVFILLALTLILHFTDLDLYIARSFFDSSLECGFMKRGSYWDWVNKGGLLLPVFITFCAFLVLAAGLFNGFYKKFRKISIFIILLMLVGPLFIVNGLLKPNWGRPRPIQCKEFKGEYRFEKVGVINLDNKNCKSFPSGHAATAFFMIFPFFIFRAWRKKKLAILFLVLGILYGLVMSYARLYQGGHFASDCLWSLAIVYLSGLLLYYVLNLKGDSEKQKSPNQQITQSTNTDYANK